MAHKTFSPASLLLELLRIPSVSSQSNRPLIDYAAGILQSAGWHLQELPYRDAAHIEKVNLLAVPPWQPSADFAVDLAFVCHTDTVPYSASWAAAVHPEETNGAIHGCGACDVKGFLACLLSAMLQIPATQFASTVALVLTADEEIGCVGATRLLESAVLRPRHIVVGEPTSLRAARAGKGYCLAEVRVLGSEAHSAHPAQGVSAIYRAARLIARIEQFADALQAAPVAESARIFDPRHTTINVGTIQGGTAKNIVPAKCTFLLEWRPLPGEPAHRVVQAVERIISELLADDPDFRCEIHVLRQQPGFETPANSALVRRWSEIAALDATAVPFSTEAPLMSSLTSSVIVVGPGDMRTAHSPREFVPIRELDLCVSHLCELLTQPLELPR